MYNLKFSLSRINVKHAFTFGIILIVACAEKNIQLDDETISAKTKSVESLSPLSIKVVNDANSIDDDVIRNDQSSEAEQFALEIFAQQRGTWDSLWIMYDATGQETGRYSGHQSVENSFDEYSQLTITVIPELSYEGHSLRVFNTREEHVKTLVVGPKGDYWELIQNPLTAVTEFKPHKNADGTITTRRFTRSANGSSGYRVFMEVCDGEKDNCYRRFEQRLTRRMDQ